EVTDVATEEQPADEGQQRVAEVTVQGWHRARLDTAREPVPHDEVGARTQRIHEAVERREVIAVVGVAHDHISATGRIDALDEGGAVAASRHLDRAGPEAAGDAG